MVALLLARRGELAAEEEELPAVRRHGDHLVRRVRRLDEVDEVWR